MDTIVDVLTATEFKLSYLTFAATSPPCGAIPMPIGAKKGINFSKLGVPFFDGIYEVWLFFSDLLGASVDRCSYLNACKSPTLVCKHLLQDTLEVILELQL